MRSLVAKAVSLSGDLLERGFWLYAWKVEADSRTVFYIGRTGDTSSVNAASPYRRLSQHLNDASYSRSNALYRRIRQQGLDPIECEYTFSAVGPIWPEEDTKEGHFATRDKAAALERAVADVFTRSGHEVVGLHPRPGKVENALLSEIVQALRDGLDLPRLGGVNEDLS